jgi:ATP-binding cassette subfamily F protein 3
MNRPLLEVKNLRKAYGRQIVLDDLHFMISEGQHIALIGRNGAGKSTMLNILMGHEEADGGTMTPLPWTKLGMVMQHEVLPSDVTTETYLCQIGQKQPWEARKLGAKFGLREKDMLLPPSALSGGYQMRVKIVAMLLQDPTLLLLDEPVNYLDLPTLMLLERFLAEYKGSFVLTAHDREFLQNTCTHTYEIERGELVDYDGPVEEYLAWKEEQKEFLRKSNKRIAKEIAHHQVFVDRFRYKASLASRAQNKIKHIARLRTTLSEIKDDLSTVRMRIPTPSITQGVAVRVEKATIGYGSTVIASNISVAINRGEKVVIAGENGKGKSTFLKTIVGKIAPLDGTVKWWHRANIGYYDQKTDATLLPNETVLQCLARMAPMDAPGERLLMMAGNFLFRNDDLEKKTSVLSGGERARLCLAGILLHEHNVLIFDEPTNHLDVETAESLAIALKDYGGTVIFVSHARTFVNELADRIYEIRGGTLRHFTGTYEEYVSDLGTLIDEESNDAESGENSPPFRGGVGGGGSGSAEQRTLRRAALKEKKRIADKLQREIDALDKEKSKILEFFFENPTDYAPEKATRLSAIDEQLAQHERDWYRVQGDIETIG